MKLVENETSMSNLIKKIDDLEKKVSQLESLREFVDRGTQLLLAHQYRALSDRGVVLPFSEVEFRNYSQSGEDGILWYIFSLVGTTNKRAVELCAGNGKECNSANLIINHGWDALLIDGKESNVELAKKFYRNNQDTFVDGPAIAHCWISAENINDILASFGFKEEIDLLTIDIDGIDYWLWKAIDMVSPRVVLIESNPVWGADRSVTVPYDATFEAKWPKNDDVEAGAGEDHRLFAGRQGLLADKACYAGASLPALVKLAKDKGYRLIGSNRIAFNAVFMRNDVGEQFFPEVSAASCFLNEGLLNRCRAKRKLVEIFEWEEV